MSVPARDTAAYGRDYLQDLIQSQFALARHIGIEVESADDDGLVLCAPLAPNANDKGTAFGGSLFAVAVLTGWAWTARYLSMTRQSADAVIQQSSIQYLAPVHGVLRASLAAPSRVQIEKFQKMLQRAGRGRIRLQVEIHQESTLATQFDGVYAAALR